ncbi:MAG: hypothetical protein RL220_1851 [Bacteroidota bacterium]
MQYIKYLFLSFLGLVGIYLVVCLFGPGTIHTSESIYIHAEPMTIYEEVADFSRWKAWSPWEYRDSSVTDVTSGAPSGVGAHVDWTSDNSGSGWRHIEEATPGKHIKMSMFFGFGETYTGQFFFEPAGDSTKVTWTFDEAPVNFFFRGFMAIATVNKVNSNMYKEGLRLLKGIAESKPKTPSLATELVDLPDMYYIGKMFRGIKPEEMSQDLYSKTYDELFIVAGGPDSLAGSPISISHKFDMATGLMDVEIAVPVKRKLQVSGDITSGTIPGGSSVRYVHKGSYEELPNLWPVMMMSVASSHEMRWSPYEVYVSNPSDTPDPAQLITWLVVPVK